MNYDALITETLARIEAMPTTTTANILQAVERGITWGQWRQMADFAQRRRLLGITANVALVELVGFNGRPRLTSAGLAAIA